MIKLIDIMQTHCRPCQMMLPFVEKLSEEFKGKVEVLTINLDEEHGEEYAVKYDIMSTPTFIILNSEGEELERKTGYMPYEGLKELVEKYL